MGSTEEASRKEKNFIVTVTKQEVVAVQCCHYKSIGFHSPTSTSFSHQLMSASSFAMISHPWPPPSWWQLLGRACLRPWSPSTPLPENWPLTLTENQSFSATTGGVDFVEAVADVELKSLDLHDPDDSIEGKLVPSKKHGVLAVQAIFLNCGGLVVACTFDHRIADAYSAHMFLVYWAQMAKPTRPTTDPLPSQPCFRRSLLGPRRPCCIIHYMSVHFSNLPPPKKPTPGSDPLISRIYYITADQLDNIQSLANSNDVINNGVKRKRTKLESFSAFLWKMVAVSAEDKRVIAKMGIVVDGRKRLSKEKVSLLRSYFGNVISTPYGRKTVAELTEKSLSWVADEVHEFLEAATTEEHFPKKDCTNEHTVS